MTVFDLMPPIDEIHTVHPGTPVKAALEIMSRENLDQLPVVKDGHVEGELTRARLLSFLHNRLNSSRSGMNGDRGAMAHGCCRLGFTITLNVNARTAASRLRSVAIR
jgi:hypothetical protein